MKVYDNNQRGTTLIVDNAEGIKAVYRSLRRAWHDDRISVKPTHLDQPVLVAGRIYGLLLDADGTFSVLNATGVCRELELV